MEGQQSWIDNWRGTGLVPIREDESIFAVFARMDTDGGNLDVWTEDVIAWVMADRRFSGDQLGTVFYGLAHLPSENPPDGLSAPGACEDAHDDLGCHVGYTNLVYFEKEQQETWSEVARSHMRICRRRRETMGPTTA